MGRPRTRLKCPLCGRLKNASECYLRPDGSIFRCKKCQSIYSKERYRKNKEQNTSVKKFPGARKSLRGTIQ